MSDYATVVENIRAFLASDVQLRSDEIVAWAEQYARLCREANDRLRQCADYLKKGLRVEAIHAADSPPNLLDMVAMLDLPELAEWKQACFRFDLPDAPGLTLDTAATLNDAYAQEQPLDGLMAHHRLLALARAPIKNRLRVMRRLSELDTSTAVWDDDIKTFERLRLEEVRTALPVAARRGEAQEVDHFRQELGDKWLVTVPPELRRLADDFSGHLRRAAGEAELRKLMPALSEAYSAMSAEEARMLLANFLAVAAQAKLLVPPDLQEQIDPIRDWLDQQQAHAEQEAAFTEACNLLQQAIDTSAPTPRLERTYRESLQFHMELDPQLEGRYRRTLHERALAVRNKRIMIFSGIAAAILLAGGIATVITWRMLRQSEIRDTDAVLQQATADAGAGSVDRAASVVKQVMEQHPRIASDPTIIHSLADFNAAATTERKRQEQFKQSMAAARAAGIEKPDNDAIKAAGSLAKTADEQQAVADIKSRIGDFVHENQAKIDEHFLDEAKSLNEEIGKRLTAELLASQAKNYGKEIDAFSDRATEMGSRDQVSAGLRQAQSKSLLALLKQKRLLLDESMTEQKLLDEVRQSTSADAQETAIKAFLAKAPDSAYAADFRRAAELVPAEQAVEKWCRLTAAWNGQLIPLTRDAALARVAQVEKYLADDATSPLAKPAGDYLEYLNNGIAAAAPDGPWKKTYHDLLINPLVHDLATLQTTERKIYYVLGDPRVIPHKLGDQIIGQDFEAITSSDISKKVTIKLPKSVLLKSEAPSVSPQAAYAKAALARIDAMDFPGWETAGTRLLRDLVASREMDPVLKAILVQNAVRLNQPLLDWSGDTRCKTVMDGLAGQNVEDIEWLNPDNPPRAALVATLNQLIGQLPQTDLLEAAAAARRNRVLAALPLGLGENGMLMKEAGNWKVQTRQDAPAGATAYAVGETGNLIAVAHREGKGWTVDAVRTGEVPAGSLLFVSAPTASQPLAKPAPAAPATPAPAPAPRVSNPARPPANPAPGGSAGEPSPKAAGGG